MQERLTLAESNTAAANEKAAHSQLLAEEARAKQKQFEAEAERSRREQEELRRQNLELQSKVEQERTARLEIEQKIAPRRLTTLQRDALVQLLRKAKGSKIEIRATNSTPESAAYATALKEAFDQAGWESPQVLFNMTIGGATPAGLTLFVQSEGSPIGALLQHSFRSVGVELPAVLYRGLAPDEMFLVVWPKQ